MHARLIVPLAIAVAMAGGCSSVPEETGQSSLRVPQRDLTLQRAPAETLAVVSAVEAPRPRVDRPAAQRARRVSRRAPATRPDIPSLEAAPTLATPAPARAPAAEAATADVAEPAAAADPRELAPGKTVTVIPASTGPSVAPAPADETP